MIETLKIKRFRAIQSLAIEDFADVNIFVGANGAGKTSVLEAVLLATTANNPAFASRLGQWRELPAPTLENPDGLTSLFHNNDLTHGPELEYSLDRKVHHLQISSLTDLQGVEIEVDSSDSSPDSLHTFERFRGLKYALTVPGTAEKYTAHLTLTSHGATVRLDKIWTNPSGGCYYIQGRRATSISEMANLLTNLSKVKQTRPFLEQLQSFDARISDVEAGIRGVHPVVQVDLGLPTKLPINVLGDGFCRFALMVTGAFYSKGQCLIVDEIDSGLHTSIISKFWHSLRQLIRIRRKQLFCTTHSDEMLMNTIDAFEDDPDALRIFRIEGGPDKPHSVKRFTYADYKKAAMGGLEVR